MRHVNVSYVLPLFDNWFVSTLKERYFFLDVSHTWRALNKILSRGSGPSRRNCHIDKPHVKKNATAKVFFNVESMDRAFFTRRRNLIVTYEP